MPKNSTLTQKQGSTQLLSRFYAGEYLWLEESFLRVKKSFDANKLPHGLLITAPQDSGKRVLALALAKSLLCKQNKSNAEHPNLTMACGGCKSCLLVDAMSHPDLSQVDCLIDNKGKQKKSIGIDQIRKLTDKLVATAQLDGWRIAVVMSVEKMTRGAFNAILKTLEEPGDKTFVLLLSSNPQQIPATIKSRCQILNIRLPENELLPWLINNTQCSEKEALEALNQCHFAPFATLEYLKNDVASQYQAVCCDLDNILANVMSPADFIIEYSYLEDGLWKVIAKYLQNVQLSILRLNRGTDTKPDSYRYVPKNLASQLYTQLLDYNRAQCVGSNLQTNLQLEAILIQWFELGRKIVHYSTD